MAFTPIYQHTLNDSWQCPVCGNVIIPDPHNKICEKDLHSVFINWDVVWKPQGTSFETLRYPSKVTALSRSTGLKNVHRFIYKSVHDHCDLIHPQETLYNVSVNQGGYDSGAPKTTSVTKLADWVFQKAIKSLHFPYENCQQFLSVDCLYSKFIQCFSYAEMILSLHTNTCLKEKIVDVIPTKQITDPQTMQVLPRMSQRRKARRLPLSTAQLKKKPRVANSFSQKEAKEQQDHSKKKSDEQKKEGDTNRLILKAYTIVYLQEIKGSVYRTLFTRKVEMEKFLTTCSPKRVVHFFKLLFASLEGALKNGSPFICPELIPVTPNDALLRITPQQATTIFNQSLYHPVVDFQARPRIVRDANDYLRHELDLMDSNGEPKEAGALNVPATQNLQDDLNQQAKSASVQPGPPVQPSTNGAVALNVPAPQPSQNREDPSGNAMANS